MFRWLAQFWSHSPKQSGLGDRGENVAAEYLVQHGFRILERQARGVYGELDLIAVDSDTIVFIEVKTRATSATGDPTEAVTPAKQKKITQSALAYLKKRRWLERRCRFDVVAILWNGSGPPDVKHYRSAFEAAGNGQMYS